MSRGQSYDKLTLSHATTATATIDGMQWKLTPVAQQKLVLLADFQLRVQRLHGLVEQYATSRTNPFMLEGPIRRAAEQLKTSFLGAGYAPMAQLAGAITIAVKRGGAVAGKARILREAVGTLRAQVESEQRVTAAEGKVHGSAEAKPD
jgi:hypothetical protein